MKRKRNNPRPKPKSVYRNLLVEFDKEQKEDTSMIDDTDYHNEYVNKCELYAKKVSDSLLFFNIYDELVNENSLCMNRDWLLDAYRENRLYVLALIKKDTLYNYLNQYNNSFLSINESSCIFPSFCIVSKERNDIVELLWTRKSDRKKGYGTHLLKELNIKYALNFTTKRNKQFFDNRNIKLIDSIDKR